MLTASFPAVGLPSPEIRHLHSSQLRNEHCFVTIIGLFTVEAASLLLDFALSNTECHYIYLSSKCGLHLIVGPLLLFSHSLASTPRPCLACGVFLLQTQ